MPDWMTDQELLDTGLVARHIFQDGRATYWLTEAGKARSSA
jgi:DNA-binding HxlR family transcriptional regulator